MAGNEFCAHCITELSRKEEEEEGGDKGDLGEKRESQKGRERSSQ